jgi:hypothetical protein
MMQHGKFCEAVIGKHCGLVALCAALMRAGVRIGPRFGLAVLTLVYAGCYTMGPGTIGRDRIDYDHAVSESWKKQLLLNLVKIRYADAPLFVDVTSIINSYTLDTAVNLGANWSNVAGGIGATDSQMLGGSGRYTDRPTITYNPITGKRFTRSLMTPVSPGVVVSLIQAGWPAEPFFRLMVSSVNGVQNRFGAALRGHAADPDFYRLTEAMTRIQSSGAVGMRLDHTKKQEWAVMTLPRAGVSGEIAENVQTVREILGLRPGLEEYRIVFGSARRGDDEIALLTRSMLEMMLDISYSIEVPQSDVEEGRVPATASFATDESAGFRPLIRIHSGPKRPADGFVSIEYRDDWFWVGDRDVASKRMFSFLLILLSLTDTDLPQGTPLVTVPTS